jgi:4-alpha-glucanotransferase
VGDLGPNAIKFAQFLNQCGLHFWQLLPLNPTSPALGNSPYTSLSAFAGNEIFVSPDYLVEDGYLPQSRLKSATIKSQSSIDYPAALQLKTVLIDEAFQKVEKTLLDDHDFGEFLHFNSSWLNDYALFMASRAFFSECSWLDWDRYLKLREESALTQYGQKFSRPILRVKFGQYLFIQHLLRLKTAAQELGIKLIGDTAFYVNHDSADVWANRQLFALDEDGQSLLVSGVPPDYYSKTGQFWGNPAYFWQEHYHQNFYWWKKRILHNLGLFDWLRLDHFRAFAAAWVIPHTSESPAEGHWAPSPGADLFFNLTSGEPLNIISEDLGIITPDVTKLRKIFDLPGMRVLQFGVGDPTGLSLHCPFRIEPDNAVYTATHDNNTAVGWFKNELNPQALKALEFSVGYPITVANIASTMVRLAWFSPAFLALTTIQDLLSLDERSRINIPGTPTGNWVFKLTDFSLLTPQVAANLKNLTTISGRDNYHHPNVLTYSS